MKNKGLLALSVIGITTIIGLIAYNKSEKKQIKEDSAEWSSKNEKEFE